MSQGPRRHRRAAVLLATLCAAALTGTGAGAALAATTPTPTPSSASPTPTASPSPTPSASASPQPSTEESEALAGVALEAQVAEASRLWATIMSANSELSAAMSQMAAMSTKINALLESLDKARDSAREATAASEKANAQLAALKVRLTKARAALRSWAFDAYSGADNADISGMLDAMRVDPDQVGDPLGDVNYLTDQRSRALQGIRKLTEEQQRLTIAADAARDKAVTAQKRLEHDKAELDKAMVGQKARVEQLRTLQLAEVAKASPVSAALIGARDEKAKAAADKLRSAVSAAKVDVVTEIGPACSQEDGVYPNGMMPAAALCPLWGAPGQSLKPRAAAAFNALSKAYAAQTGHPICVSDSYRSLARQYSVKASRGKWAATPGTSPHGRGIAVDLGCGIQNFGDPAHIWMKQNAHLYGWYHPAWAEPNGALPEPWHWQYAGE